MGTTGLLCRLHKVSKK